MDLLHATSVEINVMDNVFGWDYQPNSIAVIPDNNL